MKMDAVTDMSVNVSANRFRNNIFWKKKKKNAELYTDYIGILIS